jgi:hypothetical protein
MTKGGKTAAGGGIVGVLILILTQLQPLLDTRYVTREEALELQDRIEKVEQALSIGEIVEPDSTAAAGAGSLGDFY